jgi:hypothetical protein
MTITVGALLALSFLISVLGLFMFIWAQMNGLMRAGSDASEVIFAKGEVGVTEEPSISAPDLPTGPYQKSVHTEGQRQAQAAGHLDLAGSGLHDSSDAGAGTDLRSRSSTRAVCLASRAQRPTGGGRGGRAAVPRPPGSRRRRYSRYTQLPRSLSDDLDCQQSLGAPRAPWGSAAFPLGVGAVCGVGLSKSLMRDKLH